MLHGSSLGQVQDRSHGFQQLCHPVADLASELLGGLDIFRVRLLMPTSLPVLDDH